MPEGDTVYALARRLDTALRGRVLTHGELRVPAHATADLAGLTVLEHVTHGKHLLIRLSSDLTLHTHLLMSGSWTVSGRTLVAKSCHARRPNRTANGWPGSLRRENTDRRVAAHPR
ncbi:DNA-formamidopyrimidine glycosylase family protein [Mycobacterium sp.]|uniref:DNA-formamidopyrimidine glycosylase family protein n=1 Tax=Mycobacterium sp. TaxID=1785 RepID=UPI003D0BA3B4